MERVTKTDRITPEEVIEFAQKVLYPNAPEKKDMYAVYEVQGSIFFYKWKVFEVGVKVPKSFLGIKYTKKEPLYTTSSGLVSTWEEFIQFWQVKLDTEVADEVALNDLTRKIRTRLKHG
jgi:hypothetical protein